ncbi:MAG: hypothetical protein J6X60_12145, partial [Ruminiclostridium sp.]|nr:hypothetical protein [Ruminiclostridium sp.]
MKLNNLKASVFNSRTLFSVSFIVFLIFIGIILNIRLKTLLVRFVEGQVARQAATIAEKASETLMTEITNLQYRANSLEQNADIIEYIFPAMQEGNSEMKIGLLDTDGSYVIGENFSPADFPVIRSSFRGKGTISYNKDYGLMFSCPVYHGDNIRYVMCELCPNDAINDFFSVSCFDGMGKALVISQNDSMIIPFNNMSEDDVDFFFGNEIASYYPELMDDLSRSVSTARNVVTSEGDYYIFMADMPDTDFFTAGFVDAGTAAEGADSIVLLVRRVFILITI